MASNPLAGVQRYAGDGQNVRKRVSLTSVLRLVLETADCWFYQCSGMRALMCAISTPRVENPPGT